MTRQDKKRIALRAQWREIVALNFETDPRVLQPFVPAGTKLDTYHDNHYITMMARNCRELQPYGGRLTLFRSVEEISLRFYVARETNGEIRHGFVPLRQFISNQWAARLLKLTLRLNYEAETIRRKTEKFDEAHSDSRPTAEYQWTMGETQNVLRVKARSQMRKQSVDTKEHFFLTHRHMYMETGRGTREYGITHAPWLVWDAASGSFQCDTDHLLPEQFRRSIKGRPSSVMLCRGGDVTIFRSALVG